MLKYWYYFLPKFIFIVGEPGVFIGKIIPSNPARAFLGYVNEKESKKKIVTDVFVKGDSAFLSGKCFLGVSTSLFEN